ncbi:MAG: RNA polymerase sigma-54 factor, partial [Planctomycetaceae bacterium]|nr:RNA polymerase sigma-54 factor [Planctomycetaceae bacterium]
MHLNVSQQMRMSQQMKLAPRMIQSMEILQLPLAALQERIDQELSENIVLEQVRKEGASEDPPPEPEHEYEPPQVEIERRELVADENNSASDFERLLEISRDWPEDNYTSGSKPSANRIQDDLDRANDLMANAESRPQTLHEYLLEQFHCDAPAHLRAFGDYLIHNLDENGRLQSSLPELAAVFGGVTLEEAEAALSLVQNLDPPGVGARDLRECLLLQITPETPLREHLITLISDHLDDIIQNRLPLIERKTGYSMEDVKATIEQMRTLNPFPGRGFDTPPVQSITPDLKVEKDDNGKYTVSLIDEYVPELRLNRRYIRMLEQNPDAATKEYIKKKLESAKWL